LIIEKDEKMNKLQVDFISMCPRCNSTDVKKDFSNPMLVQMGAPFRNVCNHCGYVATTFLEVSKSNSHNFRIKKNLTKKKELGQISEESLKLKIRNLRINSIMSFIFGLILLCGGIELLQHFFLLAIFLFLFSLFFVMVGFGYLKRIRKLTT
jgi:hypothetical protein